MADFDLASIVEEEDELPKISRGRSSEDYDVLINLMEGGKIHSIPNVSEQDRAKLSQKIRGAAAKAGFKVTVRYSKPQTKIYFQKIGMEDETAPETASDATNGKQGRKAS